MIILYCLTFKKSKKINFAKEFNDLYEIKRLKITKDGQKSMQMIARTYQLKKRRTITILPFSL